MIHDDGTKYSASFLNSSFALSPSLPMMTIARIDEAIYTDDKRNSTFNSNKKEIEYNCTIIGGPYDGVKVFNVKDTIDNGSRFNGSSSVRTPIQEGKLDPPIDSPQKIDGEFVVIGFINNNAYSARILRAIPHPLSQSQDIKKADGIVKNFEFNGVYFGIDKDGSFTISFNGGPKDKDGNVKNEEASGSSFIISKDGVISISDNEGQKIEIDRKNKSINFVSADKISTQASGGWDINVGGNVKIQSGGVVELSGSIVQIGGSGNLAARVGDLVTGTDSRGDSVIATIQTGSSTTLIGG